MGNMHNSNNYCEKLPLDNSSVVVLRKTNSRKGREVLDTWSADYYSFGRSSCELVVTKTSGNYKQEEELSISINDHASYQRKDYVDFHMSLRVQKGVLIAKVTLNGPIGIMQQLPERKSPIAQGGVLKSSSFLYGRDTDRKGLVVILREKRRDEDEELPYMISVRHYFLAENCSEGVSMVAIISSDSVDGGLSVQLEKPVMQPKRELLSMFDDVKGKGWWPNNLSSTSDYPIKLSNQNHMGKIPFITSSHKQNISSLNNLSSTSDYPINLSNQNHMGKIPFISISHKQNISSLINSSGYTNGNYNGSMIFHDCQILFDTASAPWKN